VVDEVLTCDALAIIFCAQGRVELMALMSSPRGANSTTSGR